MAPKFFIPYLLVLCNFAKVSLSQNNNHTSFHQDNSLLWFSPFVTKWALEKSERQTVIGMLEIVAQRFQKLVLRTIDNKTQEIMDLPQSVAAYNKFDFNKTLMPLEAQIVYTAPEESPNMEDLLSFFDLILENANKANKLFPGTVTTIYFEHSSPQRYLLLDKIFKESRAKLESSSIKYKLGLLIHVRYIHGLAWYMKKYKYPFLLQLENVIVEITLPDETVDTPEVMFSRVVTRFLNAKKNLKESMGFDGNEAVNLPRLILMTGYRGVPGNWDATLVKFWQLFNYWILETNNTVVFYEAFDTFNPAGNLKERGWWKLKPNKIYKAFEDFEFQEKELDLRSSNSSHVFSTETSIVHTYINISSEDLALDTNKVEASSPALIAVGSVVIGILLVLIILAVYFYNLKKRTDTYARRMLKQEIQWFFKNGAFNYRNVVNTSIDDFGRLGYNRNWEIPKENFTIDKLNILGSGNKSVVCSAKIILDKELQVAVKMTNINSSELDVLQMVNEIRVLSYLGKNPFVIEFLGAYTNEAFEGNIYVFLELCPNGSLEAYLKSLNPDSIALTNCDANVSLKCTTRELANKMFHWASDIARGMSFLASKKIIHADLATRNILLNRERRAIICDFGLSSFLGDDKSHVKIDEVDIPWRWAAPEFITDRIVNEKTDVWSFGVTIWEIHSLGDIPYPDVIDSDELLQQLKSGRRLPEPFYSQHNMYSALIVHCFSFYPGLRPTFQEITGFFDTFVSQYENIF